MANAEPPRPSSTVTPIVADPASSGAIQCTIVLSVCPRKCPLGEIHTQVTTSPSGSVIFAVRRTSPPRDTVHGSHEAETVGVSFTSVTVTVMNTSASPPTASCATPVRLYRLGSVSKSSPGPTYVTTPSSAPTAKRSRLPDTREYVNASPSKSDAISCPSSTGRWRPSRFSASSK